MERFDINDSPFDWRPDRLPTTTPMRKDTRDPAAALPLKHSTYRVLLALGDDDLHGYAIMQKVEEMSGGRETILPAPSTPPSPAWSMKDSATNAPAPTTRAAADATLLPADAVRARRRPRGIGAARRPPRQLGDASSFADAAQREQSVLRLIGGTIALAMLSVVVLSAAGIYALMSSP